MRYRDFKLNEEVIGVANMSSQPGYIDAVNELLKNNSSFAMGKSGQYTFQPDPGQQVNSMEGAISGKGQDQNGKDVDQIQVKMIYKSPEIKRIAKGTSADQIAFNAGEVAEGIHAVAAFARLITRPSKPITLDSLYPIVNRLENGKTLVLKAKEVDSDIADEFRVTVSLKPEQFNAFKQLDKIYQYKKIANIANNIIDDANRESGRFADMYEKNGKFDSVSVIGDGVSGETETKTDINFDNETERKYKGYSIKAGSTGQIQSAILKNLQGLENSYAQFSPSMQTKIDFNREEAVKSLRVFGASVVESGNTKKYSTIEEFQNAVATNSILPGSVIDVADGTKFFVYTGQPTIPNAVNGTMQTFFEFN